MIQYHELHEPPKYVFKSKENVLPGDMTIMPGMVPREYGGLGSVGGAGAGAGEGPGEGPGPGAGAGVDVDGLMMT